MTIRPLARAGNSVADIASEASVGIVRRPVRSVLTALGTTLGVAAFVAIVGLTSTAGAQISSRFNALRATRVLVEDGRPRDSTPVFPPDLERRLERLNGVRAAGITWDVAHANVETTASVDPQDSPGSPLAIYAASPGYLRTTGASFSQGVGFNQYYERGFQQVALVGRAAAASLALADVSHQPAIFIDGLPFTVVGVIQSVKRNAELLLGVVVPDSTARAIWGPPESPRVQIDTRLGAAQLAGRQAPLALRPNDPRRLRVSVPPDPTTLGHDVGGDVNALFVLLAAVSLIVGTVGIANTTLVSVMERISEIGLRRALGASRSRIIGQFLTESSVLGGLGGLVGADLGLLCVLTVAAARNWTPVISVAYLLLAPVVGLATGFLAGLYPALRAGRVEPVAALRR